MARTILYGYVTRFPRNDFEMKWETGGYEGDNPEGKYRYIFTNAGPENPNGWRQPVFTRLDMEFFLSKPNDYKFEAISGRPENMRPVRPTSPAEYFDQKVAESEAPKMPPVVNEMPSIPVEAPPAVEPPKKRFGRPPKAAPTPAVS